jgi:hypothetical protein
LIIGDGCEEKRLLGGALSTGDVKQGVIKPTVDKSKLLGIIAHEVEHLIQFMKGDT